MRSFLFGISPIVVIALSTLGSQSEAQTAFTLVGNYAMGSNSVTMAAADVNGDGSPDLIIGNGNLLVLTNNGNGVFGSNSVIVASGTSLITPADINGDGYVDLVVSDDNWPGHIYVFTNNGAGNFGANAVYPVGDVPGVPVVTDVNKDGKPDIICPNAADATLSVLTNDGRGGFHIASTPATGSQGFPTSLVAGDFEHNGSIELICANEGSPGIGSTLSVLTNAGDGIFKLAATPSVGRAPNSLAAADINNDGSLDLICANFADKSLSMLTNDGAGNFITATTLPLGFAAFSLLPTNLNDGQLDLLCANYTGNSLLILTNAGNGGFGISSGLALSQPDGVVVADVNGDGKPDLICVDDGLRPTLSSYTSRSSISVFDNVPTLVTTISDDNFVVSWPSAWTNWTLLQSSDLSQGGWTPFEGTVCDNGTTKYVTNAPPAGNLFFRLGHF